MRFLFVHSWSGFSLAEWYLRDALNAVAGNAVEFKAIDLPTDGVPINDTLPRVIVTWKPDVVGFSCHYWSFREYLEASHTIKHLSPKTTVVFGGPQVNSTQVAAGVLNAHPTVDYVLRGAVQESLWHLFEASCGRWANDTISGLSYRRAGMVRHNAIEPAPSRRNAPIFCRDNAALTEHLSHAREASYETVVGCRARCAYCVYPVSKFERIDDDLVEAELRYLLAFGVPFVRVCDAHFAGVKSRAKRFLQHIARVNRRSSVKIYPDPRHVDREYIELLKAANADVTSIGVQTTNPSSLDVIKRHPVHEHLEAVQMLLEAFPHTPADCIVGLPSDAPDDVERTFRDVLDIGFSRVNAFRLHLFPGTTLGDTPEQFMDPGDVVHTDKGQLLSSRSFPVEALERVANLVHTVETVCPLVGTRRWLRERGRAGRLMDLAHRLDSATLLELRDRITSPFPSELLSHFQSSVRTIAAGLGEEPEILQRVAVDLIEYLRSSCAERRIQDFQWGTDNRRVAVVEVGLPSGEAGVWDVRHGEVRYGPAPRRRADERHVLRIGIQGDVRGPGRPSIHAAVETGS